MISRQIGAALQSAAGRVDGLQAIDHLRLALGRNTTEPSLLQFADDGWRAARRFSSASNSRSTASILVAQRERIGVGRVGASAMACRKLSHHLDAALATMTGHCRRRGSRRRAAALSVTCSLRLQCLEARLEQRAGFAEQFCANRSAFGQLLPANFC